MDPMSASNTLLDKLKEVDEEISRKKRSAVAPTGAPVDEVEDPNNLKNPDAVAAAVNRVASPENDHTKKKKEEWVRVPWIYEVIAPLFQRGFNMIVAMEREYIILSKGKSQAKEVDSQKRITIRSTNDVHKAPSGVPQMQRGTIPSSNNPGNLICTQNLEGVTSAKLQAIREHARANQLEGAFPQSGRSTVTCSAKFVGASSSNANNQASVQYPGCDGDLHENSQGLVAFHIQELSNLHAMSEKDNEEILASIQYEMALWNQPC